MKELILKNKEISRLNRLVNKLNTIVTKLTAENTILKKFKADNSEKNLVYVDVLSNTPHCKQHGAMLCMNRECTIWRCPACNVGMLFKKLG